MNSTLAIESKGDASASATRKMAQPLELPETFNYIGAFLTFRCPYKCSYCIIRFNGASMGRHMEVRGAEWIRFIERLQTRTIPVTLQGGEPGMHPDFIEIVAEISRFHPIDILSNLAFDLNAFIRRVDPARLNRPAPYAPIRASYHPEQFTLETIVKRALALQEAGFRVGLYGVLHPDQKDEIMRAYQVCADLGIDFRTKPFLGIHQGLMHGEIAYSGACEGNPTHRCECAPSELLIAPDGAIHRCHHDLYNACTPVADIFECAPALSSAFRPCASFGSCNPCDVKVKNNRFQQFGHVSVRIRGIEPL